MPLYDYQCERCGHEFERIASIKDRSSAGCPICGGNAKLLVSLTRPPIRFPEGVWDIGNKSIYISSKRQLRDEMNKHNGSVGEFQQSYSKYLDGYGGY